MGIETSALKGPAGQLGNKKHVPCIMASFSPFLAPAPSHQLPFFLVQLWSTNGVQAHPPVHSLLE